MSKPENNDWLEPKHHLLLWRLAALGGGEFLTNLTAEGEKSIRQPLLRDGLLMEEKKQNPAGKSKRPAMFLSLTDRGWSWCAGHLAWPHKNPSQKAARVLADLLPRLGRLFANGQTAFSLADFISKTSAESNEEPSANFNTPPIDPDPQTLQAAIRTQCLELGQGKENVRIRLADLRERLSAFPQSEVTNQILVLSKARELTLYRLDNPREIQAEDREAAIHTSTGEERHILYFGGLSS